MNMNRAFNLRREDRKPAWRVIDAKGRVLGRLATEIADALRGKDKAIYTPHQDAGDYVIVVNAQEIVLTGNKWSGKMYPKYTGFLGGYSETSAEDMMKKDPTSLLNLAVKRMLPKNKLAEEMFGKLRVYAGENHPHQAQVNTKK
jgi:large subunit ribosomal protein L13